MSGPNYSKLQAIWDMMMHTNQYKQAMKLIVQSEQKHPNNQKLQVMKVLCHQRSGNVVAAKDLVQEILNSGEAITDENILSSMWLALRELGLKKEAVVATRQAWEASSKQPESYVTECYFCALIHAQAFAELQRAASAEYKKHKEPAQFLWSIVANILQVPKDDNKSMLLLLSSKMLEKYFAENTTHTREAVWLHITLLSRLEKYDAALAFLGTEQALKVVPLERLPFIADVYAKQGSIHQCNSVYKLLLKDEVERDNWMWWDKYFTTLLTLIQNKGKNPPSQQLPEGSNVDYDETWEQAIAFMKEMAEMEEKAEGRRWLRRSPKLAVLHFMWLRLKAGDKTDPTELLEGITEYVKWLSCKLQSHMDIVKFLPLITEMGKAKELVALFGEPEEPLEDVKSFYYAMSGYKMKWVLGEYDDMSDEETIKLIKKLAELAKGGSEKLSADMDWSERPHGEEALQISCNILFHKYCKTGDLRWVIQCLVFMESLPSPKNNTQLQQWHFLVPPLIGLPRTDKAKELDIRFIQSESLSYFIHNSALSLEGPGTIKQVTSTAKSFYKRYESDHSEITFTAWKNGITSKMFEMFNMHNRILNSVTMRSTFINLITAQYLETCDIGSAERTVLDGIFKLEDDMGNTEELSENWDTMCVAATLQCAPHTPRSDLLKERLLSTTSASKDTHAHNIPAMLANYYLLQVLRAVLYLSVATHTDVKAAPSKKGKKGKKESPKGPASGPKKVDYTAVATDYAAEAGKALGALKHEAVDTIVKEGMFTACKNTMLALYSYVGKACKGDDSLDEEAKALGSALTELAKALEECSEPWKGVKIASQREVNYAFRTTVPYVRAMLQVLGSTKNTKGRTKNSCLKEGLGAFAKALGVLEENCQPLKAQFNDWQKTDEECLRVLDVISGSADTLELSGEQKAAVSFARRYSEYWTQSLTRISQTARSRKQEVESLLLTL
eukprot:TRINITY_DN1264_c1_g1_i7.p1 TRINITY_DN1264_c1_g1~~TRINITY_DN1264_c1_g1_i7.p1  ORF type:complete len:957 (+),score=317.77 TRINITY_DN1264_c1_g1_i7:142-3012(+)